MGARSKILVVDDSASVRDSVRWALEQAGYDVAVVETPFGFSQALNAERPNLVLMDMSMPGLSGDKLVEIARRYNPHCCPIVLFSSQPVEELRSVVTRLGLTGFIPKTIDGLASEVARFLRESA